MAARGVRPGLRFVAAVIWLAATACGSDELESVAKVRELSPYPNPFLTSDPMWAAQPQRSKPLKVLADAAGATAWVTLSGTPDRPGRQVAVVDVAAGRLVRRVDVGAGATGLALHPDGEVLVVTNKFANYLSIIDTAAQAVVQRPEVDFYAVDAAFSPAGDELWITNRWRDAVAVWDVHRTGRGLAIDGRLEPGIAVGDNPRDLAMSASGDTVAVAALSGLSVSLIDRKKRSERLRVDLGAPANGLAFAGDLLVVATLSRATHHLPLAGPDTDGDGKPGDGTPNMNFQDLQNEIAVLDVSSGVELWRYTSDTICCKDYRDVDPLDLARHGDLLPPSAQWIVGGALPEQVVARPSGGGFEVWLSYSASNQLQRFQLDAATGAMTPSPAIAAGGHAPHGLAFAGAHLLVTHRLSDTLASVQLSDGKVEALVPLGQSTAAPFPATDAEIGELFNFVTAPFSVDGDQSCAHCHREDGNINKAFSMPLTRYPGVGSRMTMAYRGMADTRPWFFESAMEEHNFKPVINEFARIENFCCSDWTLWPEGAPADCQTHPPASCATAGNPASSDGFDATRAPAAMAFAHPRPTGATSRQVHFQQVAQQLMGRDTSFGDGLYFEDPITQKRSPVALNFDGMTRALGLFLLVAPRLLPNPNPAAGAAVERGRALFEHSDTGCASCHPSPTFAVSSAVNPAALPMRFGPVVSPNRDEGGLNLDLFASGFVATFPEAQQDSCEALCGEQTCAADPDACNDRRNVYFGVPSLRGIWDRADKMLHDGRARGLREVICTPGHPALLPGQVGHNVSDGVVDSHGGTSHLTARDVADLIAYLKTL